MITQEELKEIRERISQFAFKTKDRKDIARLLDEVERLNKVIAALKAGIDGVAEIAIVSICHGVQVDSVLLCDEMERLSNIAQSIEQ